MSAVLIHASTHSGEGACQMTERGLSQTAARWKSRKHQNFPCCSGPNRCELRQLALRNRSDDSGNTPVACSHKLQHTKPFHILLLLNIKSDIFYFTLQFDLLVSD